MNIMLIENLSKSYGDKTLFENITFGIDQGQKIALIAKNGTGKTSLIRAISGETDIDEGKITFKKDLKISFLAQEPDIKPELSIYDALFSNGSTISNTIKHYQDCLNEFSQTHSKQSEKKLELATAKMDSLDAWTFDSKLKEILSTLNINYPSKKIYELSGGQIKKVALAKVLLEDAELIIMDEPTNHLDIEMIEWMEGYLNREKLSILVVTHDRFFLNNVCNEIIEMTDNSITRYKGNYEYYIEKKAEIDNAKSQEIEKAKNLYKKELDWMRRQPSARGTKAKARIESFYNIKDTALQAKEKKQSGLSISMERIGGKILEINNISKSYDNNLLIDNFSYTFKRGERIGISGSNGCGKSTLLDLITSNIRPDLGKIVVGQTVVFGYYTQKNLKYDEDKYIIDIVKDIAEVVKVGKYTMAAAQFLEYFNFPRTMHYQYFSSLSGGEKRRIFLITTLMTNPNFLILDEPTNDLDIPTLQILEDFLLNYQGCLLIVSHDRYFMDKLVDHVFVFEKGGKIKDFHSSYSEYRMLKKQEEKALKSEQRKTDKISKAKPKTEKKGISYSEKRELESLENELAELEEKKAILIEKMNNETDSKKIIETSSLFSELQENLNQKETRWLELEEKKAEIN